MAEASGKIYDKNFYLEQKDESYISATKVIPIIIDAIHPKTMIDVGCGVGTWTRAFQEFGVNAYGIDGDYVDRSMLMIDSKKFFPHNLEEQIVSNHKFDLAISLEVAEHLTPPRSSSFVSDLTKISDVILFSAAIPGQGGTNHINEQFQSYWQKIFRSFGFVAIDYVRPKIWSNREIEWWYRQNILIYVRESELKRFPILFDFYIRTRDCQILDMYHPARFIHGL